MKKDELLEAFKDAANSVFEWAKNPDGTPVTIEQLKTYRDGVEQEIIRNKGYLYAINSVIKMME